MKSRVDTNVMPSATPSDDEIREWNALPRDEQVRRLRLALTNPDCLSVSALSMGEILEKARTQADERGG